MIRTVSHSVQILRKSTQKPAVHIREPRPLHRMMEDGELLPQGQVLEGQPAAGLECGAKRAEERPDHGGMLTPTREKDQLRWGWMSKWKAQDLLPRIADLAVVPYRQASRRALISWAPTQGTPPRRVTPCV